MKKALAYSIAAVASVFFSPGALAACYVVYGPAQQVIYRSTQSPVDLSYQLHDTVPTVVPGGTLVFTPDNDGCDFEVNQLAKYAQPKNSGQRERAPRAPRG